MLVVVSTPLQQVSVMRSSLLFVLYVGLRPGVPGSAPVRYLDSRSLLSRATLIVAAGPYRYAPNGEQR